MNGPTPGTLIVVCGLLGSGKTTLARRLEDERGGVRFCPDEWLDALGFDRFEPVLRDRVERLQWTVVERLLALGDTAIIEWGTWSRADRDRVRLGARALGARVELHLLTASDDELWRRVDARERGVVGRRVTRAEFEECLGMWEAPTDEELALFDP